MVLRRYDSVGKVRGGQLYGTTRSHVRLRRAAESGRISVREHVVKESERLDTLAGEQYGNGRLWWVIAAASGVGWGLQVPPGTRLLIPLDLGQVGEYV